LASLSSSAGRAKAKRDAKGRFADILGELYLLSCALKRFEDDGRPEADLPVVELAFQDALFVVYERLDEILTNLPSRSSAWLLRRLVFPWGRRWRRASDQLSGRVADLLVLSPAFREHLCEGMFFDDSPQDILGCLEHAVRVSALSAPAEQKLRVAIRDGRVAPYAKERIAAALDAGGISEIEAEPLRVAAVAVRRATDVDHFTSGELWQSGQIDVAKADAA